MPPLSPSSHPRRETILWELYAELPPIQQFILQFKALILEAGNPKLFMSCLSRNSQLAHIPFLKNLSYPELSNHIRALQAQELLTDQENCASSLILRLSGLALDPKNPHALVYIGLIRSYYPAHFNIHSHDLTRNKRAIHLALQSQQEDFFHPLLASYEQAVVLLDTLSTTVYASETLDPAWLDKLPPLLQALFSILRLYGLFCSSYSLSFPLSPWIERIHTLYPLLQHSMPPFISWAFSHIFALTNQKKPDSFIPHPALVSLQGALSAFVQKDFPSAKALFKKHIKEFSHECAPIAWPQLSIYRFFYVLFLFITDRPAGDKFMDHYEHLFPSLEQEIIIIFHSILCHQRDKALSMILPLQKSFPFLSEKPFLSFFMAYAGRLLEVSLETWEQQIPLWMIEHHTEGSCFYAHLFAELSIDHPQYGQKAQEILESSPFQELRFTEILTKKSSWEYSITQLETLLNSSSDAASSEHTEKRCAFLIQPQTPTHIEAIEQRLNTQGDQWIGKKNLPLSRLFSPQQRPAYLSTHDQMVLKGLCMDHPRNGSAYYYWDLSTAFYGLLDHPAVFDKETGAPLLLKKEDFQLIVSQKEEEYHLTLFPYIEKKSLCLIQRSQQQYDVFFVNEDIKKMMMIIPIEGLCLPLSAKEKLLSFIHNNQTKIRVVSDVEDDTLESLDPDNHCCLQIFPLKEGLKCLLSVRPFGEKGGNYFQPGKGPHALIEQKKRVIRSFEEEARNKADFIKNCPSIEAFYDENDQAIIPSLEESLEFLLELDTYQKEHSIYIEWPKGQPLKTPSLISGQQLQLSIKGSAHWFSYEGTIETDSEGTLDLQEILALLEDDTQPKRFIRLKNNDMIALTERLAKQLQSLKKSSEKGRIYELNAHFLEDLSHDVGKIDVDSEWKTHLQTIQTIQHYSPTLAPSLEDILRPYQKEGFIYLARLAHWHIGACLADDMGLGKTLQSIAVLLEQAPRGPCLVIAPTSVCSVWATELARFAPSLSFSMLGQATHRAALIEAASHHTVVITSYHLLHSVESVIVEKEWQMVILDEAQAIKNSDTKRWKIVSSLKNKARIALTGTPIENHLGELWSIFRFLNPGLLGSFSSFQKRFILPIEKDKNKLAQETLKKIIQPYFLRRTKDLVLTELPPKIEQTLWIDFSPEEETFYQALREKTLQSVQEKDRKNKRFSILAGITRLRQACCHSSLAQAGLQIPSSKMRECLILLKEIIENNHKVLVFSQYVGFLSLLRPLLDQDNIAYHYLDGATPAKDRPGIVDSFQQGESPVFLISLKAGGTGLNLTAADYVIILDPWWNPAVEEQATSRAHRMGQTRPVTIYRLMIRHSIEEKIIALHAEKKNLAQELLSEGAISGSLDETALLSLLY